MRQAQITTAMNGSTLPAPESLASYEPIDLVSLLRANCGGFDGVAIPQSATTLMWALRSQLCQVSSAGPLECGMWWRTAVSEWNTIS